jgi:tripartite-type tricarboxylate transporter receptor subunit TctC
MSTLSFVRHATTPPLHALLIVVFTALMAAGARAEWPDKPIRFVVPFAAGGAVPHVIADGMSQVLGQPVVVEHKPGADATIATAFVAQAPADGYTILFAGNTGFSAAPYLHRNIGYHPVKDFTPVSMLGTVPFFLTVNKEVPAATLRELVEYVRAHPGKVAYASGFSMAIIAPAQLAKAEKLDMLHVPYNGESRMILDLLTNRVQMSFATGFTILPHVKEGRIRALAVVMDERNDALPDVPTMAEAGFGDIAVRAWIGVVAPAGLPRHVQLKLSHAVNESLRMESTRKLLAQQGFRGQGSTPEEMAAIIETQLQAWGQAVRAAGIEPN